MDHREAMDKAEYLAYINPGVTIVLRDIPEQVVPPAYKKLRKWMRHYKYENGSKITVHTLPF